MNIVTLGAGESIPSKLPLDEQYVAAGANFGNLLIGGGLRSWLRRYSCVRNFSSFRSVGECAEWADLVAVGAANWLWAGFDFGWLGDLIRDLDKPVAMVGLGAQTAERISVDHPPAGTLRMLREVADRSTSVGVRGFHSAEIMATLGMVDVTVLGCPSLYVSSADLDLKSQVPSKTRIPSSRVCVGFSRRVSGHSFDRDRLRDFERALLGYALEEDAIVILQDEIDEMRSIIEGSVDLFKVHSYFGIEPNSAASNFLSTNSQWFLCSDQWTDNAVNNSSYIGSRLHGTISFLREGKPALLIAHDSRTLEVARTFAIPHVSLLDLPRGENACDQLLRSEVVKSLGSRSPWSLPSQYRDSYEQFWRNYGLVV